MWSRTTKNIKNVVSYFRTVNFSSQVVCHQKVCIVGSGPAGFYTAQHLLKNCPTLEIDMFEKLPVPFGLVRYGVAPDHPDVKNVINTFTAIAKSGRLQFVGNVTVGKDVTLNDLRNAYDVVVLAYGAAQDRWLGISGENLCNVVSARKFVGWYNGLPEESHLKFDLDAETAVIIGQGNVALDIARILLTPIDMLKKTDIAQHALEALSQSKIKNVKIVGRRGPLQVAFTIKELREMIKLPGNSYRIHLENPEFIDACLPKTSRPRKRLTELMLQSSSIKRSEEDSSKQWELIFHRTPIKIVGDSNANKVNGLVVGINHLTGDDWENPQVEDTGLRETIPCGMILKSIGYKSLPLSDELPFDHAKGIIRQTEGRVEGMQGVFCSGWVASGPVGVIASTMQSGHDVGKRIIEDLKNGIVGTGTRKPGRDAILSQLEARNVEPVTFVEWEALDNEERERASML
ncbi:NADPH:adrenodoxin oxidoreductase, mitochondrial-like isoform X2 [Daphnia pulex]|uniref:NADPH:adrenodoxin oxidoreductase, mitochondrial-like isoform X2 n=1 Tax=Daphnia pulex TaxID=6669 RepID=UPI001EDF56DA|nr:NADPH:adrenodoxin oxidoreductase, mitochondrial-like isoform X2 [Daphnia pulex]